MDSQPSAMLYSASPMVGATEGLDGASTRSLGSFSGKRKGSFQIKLLETSEELHQAMKIRTKVFQEEQNIPVEIEFDGHDEKAFHVLVVDKSTNEGGAHSSPIATGRVLIVNDDDESSWKKQVGIPMPMVGQRKRGVLGRIAVLPDYRRQGLGRKVVRFLEEVARQHDARHVSLTPHSYLEDFYGSLGFRRVPGSSTFVAGPATLIHMAKQLH